MQPDFTKIAKHFEFEGTYLAAYPYGFGHINDTYTVDFQKSDDAKNRYILQRINHNVFKRPEELMQNIRAVTAHLRLKIRVAGGNPKRETLNLVPTTDGNIFYKTPEGNYWRGYTFVKDAQTYEIAKDHTLVYNAAQAFGRFQQLLSDFPADQLYETIPNFHHTARRFQAFTRSTANALE